MAEFEWTRGDVRDLVSRERRSLIWQNCPYFGAASLLALWLRTTEPVWAGVFLGVAAFSIIATVAHLGNASRRWSAFLDAQPGSMRVEIDGSRVHWQAAFSSRALVLDAVAVRRIGGVWAFLVGGQEIGYLPHRALNPTEAAELQRRAGEHEQVGDDYKTRRKNDGTS